jgi:5'-deoxynucleotidase YfbR-like HD superfamily hydrolase
LDRNFLWEAVLPAGPPPGGPEDVDIYDIVHALANQSRFGGHCTHFYSVAQHSVLVSMMCSSEDALWGLLHDASEAYLVDLPSPLKSCPEFAFYREAEANLMGVICDVFGLSREEPASIRVADKRVLATEARDLTMTEGRGWATRSEPYEFHIKPWAPEVARAKFISRFHDLTRRTT